MLTKYATIINNVCVYSSCVEFSLNYVKKCKSRNGKKWNITYKKMTNKQIQKNHEDNIYATITSYIHKENMMTY